jgi:HAMP domain-containing protein
VALGAIAGTIFTVWHVESFPDDMHYELIGFFAVAGLAISFAVNFLALKLALAPLDHIQSAVDEVRRGRRDIRLDTGALSDERFEWLAATFNQMLDTLEQDAHQRMWLSSGRRIGSSSLSSCPMEGWAKRIYAFILVCGLVSLKRK